MLTSVVLADVVEHLSAYMDSMVSGMDLSKAAQNSENLQILLSAFKLTELNFEVGLMDTARRSGFPDAVAAAAAATTHGPRWRAAAVQCISGG